MRINPLNDRVVIEVSKGEAKTAGGILLPEMAKEKPNKGKVIAAGPGKVNDNTGKRLTMDVKIGDEVYFSKYSGTEVKVDEKEYCILKESDILAKDAR